MISRFPLWALAGATAFVISCGPPPPPAVGVQRVGANSQIDLSGQWNDTDANIVAREMIKDCLSRPWAMKFKAEKGREPVVRLSLVRNRSADHIETRFFTKQVEMELINSGMVKVSADYEEAQAQRFERADQAANASDQTVKSQGQEAGSDFLLTGWIVVQNDAAEGQEVKAYVTTMELVDSQSNIKVWMKVHPLKKVVSRAASEW